MTKHEGFTTPDASEALVKRKAMEQCRKAYVLSDASKFGQISSVTFRDFKEAEVITDRCPKEFEGNKILWLCGDRHRWPERFIHCG